jgi:hypothetical protein
MNRYGSADRKAPTTTKTNPAALTIAKGFPHDYFVR